MSVTTWLNAIDSHGIQNKRKMNIVVYSIASALGIFLGIFFLPLSIIKDNNSLLASNILSLIIGLGCLIFLLFYTNK